MDIIGICKKNNVTLKSTFKNSSIPVNVVCNECNLKFPVTICGSTQISCPACSVVEKAKVVEESVKFSFDDDDDDTEADEKDL